MLEVPVVWVRYSGPGNPCCSKVEGAEVYLIGEEGENVLAVTRGTRVYVPIFRLSALEESKATEGILERMLALAECCLLETGKVGTVYGFFRSSFQIVGSEPSYIKEVGLVCTTSEFDPLSGNSLKPEGCWCGGLSTLNDAAAFGLPMVVEIE